MAVLASLCVPPTNARRGSRASLTASPMKISSVSKVAKVKNTEKAIQGACRLAFASESSRPKEGESIGSPNPRKSSAVSDVIEPFNTNGK